MASIHDQIITSQNHTQEYQSKQPKTNSKTVSGDDFLQLLTQQLQYQDPLNPMDNTDMLAQEAQFATLTQMESLASNFSKFTNSFQANCLLGQIVEIQKEDGDTTMGIVDYVDYTDASGASVSVNGTLHPLSNIKKVYPAYYYPDGPSNGNNEGNVENAEVQPPKEEENNKEETSTVGEYMMKAVENYAPKALAKVSEYIKK